MGADIYTISQTAHNQHIVAHLVQLADKPVRDILPVSGDVARAYDTDDFLLVQVGITLIVQHQRRIGALQHALGVVVVEWRNSAYLVLLHILQLVFGPFHRVAPVLQGGNQAWRAIRYQVGHLVAVFV